MSSLTSNDSTTSSSLDNLVLIIAGPTGVGKSDVAASLCQRHDGGMVVSADSVQAYCGVQIGANKPTREEMQMTPHLLINVVTSKQQYNAAEWRRDAIYCIQQLLQKDGSHTERQEVSTRQEEDERRKLLQKTIEEAKVSKGYPQNRPVVPIVVGGTMMYMQWLVHGRPDAVRPSNEAVAKAHCDISKFQNNNDWDGAVQFVSSMGPTFASRVESALSGQDWYRLRRTLEVAYTVLDHDDDNDDLINKLYSGEREGGLQDLMACNVRCFFLCPHHRMNHTAIVDARCEEMVMSGLIQETAELVLNKEMPDMAARAIGYRQTLEYLQRRDFKPMDTAAFEAYLHEFTTATRRYAKKQMQWFRKDDKFAFCPVVLTDSKEKRVEHAADTIWKMCQLSRQEYERQLVDKDSLSGKTKRANEEQGKGMKFYQYQAKALKAGTIEFERVLQQADECTRRIRQAAIK